MEESRSDTLSAEIESVGGNHSSITPGCACSALGRSPSHTRLSSLDVTHGAPRYLLIDRAHARAWGSLRSCSSRVGFGQGIGLRALRKSALPNMSGTHGCTSLARQFDGACFDSHYAAPRRGLRQWEYAPFCRVLLRFAEVLPMLKRTDVLGTQ